MFVNSQPQTPDLRVTRRCLMDDLGLPGTAVYIPLSDLAVQKAIVKAFLGQRGQNPVGQETVTELKSRIVAWTLHGGEDRGATWYDKAGNVVWLLASRFHRSGERDDAYPYFRSLDRAGNLLPTEQDYLDLEKSRNPDFAKILLCEPPALIERALAAPGVIYPGRIAGRLRVRLLYQPGDIPTLTVAISNRVDPGDMRLPEDWIGALLGVFFPTTSPEACSALGNSPLRSDECAFWEIVEAEN